jgi:hypothetical protein
MRNINSFKTDGFFAGANGVKRFFPKNRMAHFRHRDYCDLRVRQYGSKPTETGECICHSDFRRCRAGYGGVFEKSTE